MCKIKKNVINPECVLAVYLHNVGFDSCRLLAEPLAGCILKSWPFDKGRHSTTKGEMGQMCSAADTSSRNSVSPLYLAPVLDFLTSKHIEAQPKVWCFVFCKNNPDCRFQRVQPVCVVRLQGKCIDIHQKPTRFVESLQLTVCRSFTQKGHIFDLFEKICAYTKVINLNQLCACKLYI